MTTTTRSRESFAPSRRNAAATKTAAAEMLPLPPSADPRLRLPRQLVWLYLLLWVIEGSLRKWLLPELANPLLIVRDPVMLLLYAVAMQRRVFPWRQPFVVAVLALGVLSMLCAFVATQAPWYVIAYGFRANFLHLPLIFLAPLIFDESDVRKIGRWVLLLALPMAALVLAQFRVDPSHWLNIAAGGEGRQMESALNHVRPSGTFSFTNGMCDFTALLAAFFLFCILEKKAFHRGLWLAAGGALTLMVVLSGSRATAGIMGLVLAGVALACVLRPAYWKSTYLLFALGGVIFLALGSFAVFREGLDVFSYRFGDEDNVKKTFFVRYFGTFLPQPNIWDIAPFAGIGLGMGTNVASSLIMGRRYFMLAENEFDRVIVESGPLLGSAFILLRYALVIWLFQQVLRALRCNGRPLPLLLLCAGGSSILIGQYAQPTELGFAVIAAGLCLSALRQSPGAAASGADDGALAAEAALPAPNQGDPKREKIRTAAAVTSSPSPARPRGRSAYAERMHKSRSETATAPPPRNAPPPPAASV